MVYKVVDGRGWHYVAREPNTPIICNCGGRMIPTNLREVLNYGKFEAYLWRCGTCKGAISVEPMPKEGEEYRAFESSQRERTTPTVPHGAGELRPPADPETSPAADTRRRRDEPS